MLDVMVYFIFAVLLSFGIFFFLLIKHKLSRKKNKDKADEGNEGIYYTDERD